MLRNVDRWLARRAGYRLLLVSKARGRSSRSGRRLALAVEKLESRAMLAGDLCSLPAACETSATIESTASEPRVALVLELTNPDGSALTNLVSGQEFVLHVLAEDLRAVPHGVFAAYLDVGWDAAKAEVSGPVNYGSDYFNGPRSHVSLETPGLIDEGGAFAGLDELGGGPHEVFNVPLRAKSAGDLVFTADAAEDLLDQVLVYDAPDGEPVVAPEQVQFGQVAVTITPAPEPEPSPALGDPIADTEEMGLPVEIAANGDSPESLTDSEIPSGAALAVAMSAESAQVATAPVNTTATNSALDSHSGTGDATSVLISALLKSKGSDDPLATLGKSGSTSGESSDATIDASLPETSLTNIGPV
jgi:hypothetical protein